MSKAALAVRQTARVEGPDPEGPWLVVVTKCQCERPVRDRLVAAGFEVYLPMRLKELPRRKGQPVSAAPVPFIPRHLFARPTAQAPRWQEICTTYGVQRVICDPRRPTGVSDRFLRGLMAREEAGMLRLGSAGRNAAAFKPGEKVSTLGGLLDALCVEVVDGRRATLLASFFNSASVRITVPLR